MRRFLTALVVVALLGACGSDDSSDSATTTSDTDTNAALAPFHAVPDGAQVVWGSASCRDRPRTLGSSRVSSTCRTLGSVGPR